MANNKYSDNFDFDNLFVLDLANNHQGSIDHGLRVIEEHAQVCNDANVKAAIKFQFRDIPDFVHPDDQIKSENKHAPRFISTKIEWTDYKKMASKIKEMGLLTMCTPFDEASVDKITELGFDILKIASCSASDWPLLKKAADSGLPMVVSTGGLSQAGVDALVSFLTHKACDFSIMHCVSVYPTPDEQCNLNNIAEFKSRYPGITIGWSTHEPPFEQVHVGLAYSLGARMFERHVGVPTEDITLNLYSSNPSETKAWINAKLKAETLLGCHERQIYSEEQDAIAGLKRGVFVKSSIKKGNKIANDDIFFAFPYREGQISSGEFKHGFIASENISKNGAVTPDNYKIEVSDDDICETILKTAIHEVKAMIAKAKIHLHHEFTTEYSHHYGIKNFRETGAVLIDVVNKEYCKKILVQLPGQQHPLHMHKLKTETFIVVSGELISELDGKEFIIKEGEQLTVPAGTWHRFKTDTGVIFEEISTTAYKDDSYYKDAFIRDLTSSQRKTVVDHWGRFQISEQLRSK